MDRTADKSTPQIPEATGFPLPWDEALKRAGSLDKLRPYLHMGQIQACHGGLYSWPDVRQRSGPGYFKPEWWAHAYVQAGRLMFFIEEAMFGPPVQEQVFAYDSSIVLDSVAFDAFFPVASLPPAEHQGPCSRAVEGDAAALTPPVPDEPPPGEVEQQRPLLLLPDEPQFEGPRKWRPDEVQTWFANAKQIHPQEPEENKNVYARRLYEHMKNDFEEDIPWTEWTTLRRRLDDPATKND